MNSLEIISRLCSVTEMLAEIVEEQQTTIERSKIEDEVKEDLRKKVKDVDDKMDALEYAMRDLVK